MWKRLVSILIVVLPVLLWELSLRPKATIPFNSERDSRLVKDVIMGHRYLFGGNSMVGALPRESTIVDPVSGQEEASFNLEYVFHRYSNGIIFRVVSLLNRMEVKDKVILLNIDSHQLGNTLKEAFYSSEWSRVEDKVVKGRYHVYDRDPTLELYGFRDFTRPTLTDILKGFQSASAENKHPVDGIRLLSFIRWSIPVSLMKLGIVSPNTVRESVFDGFQEDDFSQYYPLLGELVKAKAIPKELMKEKLSPLLHKPLMNGYKNPPKNRSILVENLDLLKKELLTLEAKGNRVVLLRLMRDPELINYENETFPEVKKMCDTWGSGCIDVTGLKIFLFDGIHPHDEDAELELAEIKKQLTKILRKPKT